MPAGGGQGQPAPFLRKTYDLVSDASTDNIISWGPHGSSFIVWQPVEFSRRLLPSCFKHNNFSSFVRQLNTYGFRKVADNWEFVNEGFLKHDPGALSRISRRKPSSRLPEGAQPQALSGDDSPALAHGPTSGSMAAALAFGARGAPAPGPSAFSRGSAFVRSLPQELPAGEAPPERGASLPPPGKAWDAGSLALGGLQRFGRLVDSVLQGDREGLAGGGGQPALGAGSGALSSGAAGGPDSATSSGTDSGGGKRKRGGDAEVGPADGGEAVAVTRPRAGHLEGMTQLLLSDVAGQGRRLHELAAEVAALRGQAAPPAPKRRSRGSGAGGGGSVGGGDWQACLEEQTRCTEQLADQFADQVAVNDELWASHSALEARLAALEAGGSAPLEQRLAEQEQRGAAAARESGELRARVRQLEAALQAEREATGARVWQALLQAASGGGGAPLAGTLQRLLDAAAARAAAPAAARSPAAASAARPEQQLGPGQPERQAAGEPAAAAGVDGSVPTQAAAALAGARPAEGHAAAASRPPAAAADRPAAELAGGAAAAVAPASRPGGAAGGAEQGHAAERRRQPEALPGSMAALGLACTPETCGSLYYSRGGGRGRKRPSHADRASERYGKLPPAAGAAPRLGGRAPLAGLLQGGGVGRGPPEARQLPQHGQQLAPQLLRQAGGTAQAGGAPAAAPKREPPEPQAQGQALASPPAVSGSGVAPPRQSAAC